MAATELYRHFSASGDLLYVGIANCTALRLKAHQRESSWAHEITRIEIERFPDRASAMTAERAAISAERPLHNIANTVPHPEMETLRRYMDAMSPSEQAEFCADVDVNINRLRRAMTATNRIGVKAAIRLTTRSRGVFNVRRLFPELDIYDYAGDFLDAAAAERADNFYSKLIAA